MVSLVWTILKLNFIKKVNKGELRFYATWSAPSSDAAEKAEGASLMLDLLALWSTTTRIDGNKKDANIEAFSQVTT